MRIAVCLSGQLRKWELGWENQNWFWTANQNYQVDFFSHTWTYSWDRTSASKPYTKRDVTKEEHSRFVERFQIKKSIFDDTPQTEFGNSDHWGGLFYSFVNSLLLKKEYELENDFTYDIVIKSRPDVVFNPKLFLHFPELNDGVLYTTHGGIMERELNMVNFNDCVFLGNNRTMDLLMNIFHYRMHKITIPEENVHPLGPGVLMNEYFRDFGIYPVANNLVFIETILREGCPENLDLFNTEEFALMEKYYRDWYTH